MRLHSACIRAATRRWLPTYPAGHSSHWPCAVGGGRRWLAATAQETRDDIGVGPGAAGLTVAEWSKKKNADKGPAVSARFAGEWCADDSMAIEVDRVPGVPAFMPAL